MPRVSVKPSFVGAGRAEGVRGKGAEGPGGRDARKRCGEGARGRAWRKGHAEKVRGKGARKGLGNARAEENHPGGYLLNKF